MDNAQDAISRLKMQALLKASSSVANPDTSNVTQGFPPLEKQRLLNSYTYKPKTENNQQSIPT